MCGENLSQGRFITNPPDERGRASRLVADVRTAVTTPFPDRSVR